MPWNDFSLEDSNEGFFTGTILLRSSSDLSQYSLDVEINGDPPNGVGCNNGRPICTRMFINLDSTQIDNGETTCSDQLSAFQSSISSLSRQLTLNRVESLLIDYPQALADNCLVGRQRYVIKSIDTGSEVSSGSIVVGSNPITFTPVTPGNYELRVYLETIGMCSQVSCDWNPFPGSENLKANFCVPGVGATSCTVTVPTNTPPPETISAFSLCRQIPVLTDQNITDQLKNVPAAQRVAAEADLKRRADKQRLEKVACCQCTFGTREIDPNTGACRGEQGSEAANRVRQGFKPGLYTAVGCIGADSDSIVTRLVRIGLGIAGGVALLMILAGSFMFSTSQGDPKKASEAKELITSAVIGLVFIIFSVTLLQFIGVTILHLPGFGSVAQ